MSYDFLLMPRHPGQSWRELLDANEQRILEQGDSPLSPAARTRLERIADRLQAHDPQLERCREALTLSVRSVGPSGAFRLRSAAERLAAMQVSAC